ncbi:phosphate transport system regulatory protein PhoU [Bacteroidetes/Chlorobi group bacterium ChocPot_Mid]|nr:MAG: phosphate transport system regulatory protein PhoU [Bacteroidetes/Chlorobi group bacterium ChocPot_Mid]
MIEEHINRLKGKIVSYTYHVENMLKNSIKGLIDSDVRLLTNVIEIDEKESNKMDNNIEKECIAAIAQFSPKAMNLRTLLMIMKMNKDIERMGDHCSNICYNSLDIIKMEISKTKFYKLIEQMTSEVQLMLKHSIESFVNEDIELAKSVRKRDEKVDKYQKDLTSYFIKKMKKKPEMVECSLFFIKIVNNLERIADLSTNIAEDVVFALEGKVIKH